MRVIEALPALALLALASVMGFLTINKTTGDDRMLAAVAIEQAEGMPQLDAAEQAVLHAAHVTFAASDLEGLRAAGLIVAPGDRPVRPRLLAPDVRWTEERAAQQLAASRALVGAPDAEERAAARQTLAAWLSRMAHTFFTLAVVAACVALSLFGAASALVARGGLLLNLIDVEVHTRDHGPASRWRCAWRAAMTWVAPLLFACASLAVVAVTAGVRHFGESFDVHHLDLVPRAALVPADVLLLLAGVATAVTLVLPIWRPRRSVQDILARTQLLPR
jgi:hypothetical protein